MNDDANENNNGDYKANIKMTAASRFFEYETKIIGSTPDNNSRLDADVVSLSKYLRDFLRFLDLIFD